MTLLLGPGSRWNIWTHFNYCHLGSPPCSCFSQCSWQKKERKGGKKCISMVTTGIKNASKLHSAKGEWQQKGAMTAGNSMFSTDAWQKCTTLGQCTKQLLLTCTGWCTNNHIHVSPSPHLNNGTALSINSAVADNGFSPVSAHLFTISCIYSTFLMLSG